MACGSPAAAATAAPLDTNGSRSIQSISGPRPGSGKVSPTEHSARPYTGVSASRRSPYGAKRATNASSESALTDAHNIASSQGAKALLLNFSNLEYMNSSGIGLLVALLVRANRHGQQLLAYGLNDHYRHIFELTRLTDAIGVHDSEADALAAASGAR